MLANRLPLPYAMPAATPSILYGTAWKETRTADLVLTAIRAGFRGIDTANQRKHYFEAGVGDALRRAYAEGIVSRDELFLQTKFTYRAGQDHRLPYDPRAPLAAQVKQSLATSLSHLGTDYVDSFILHGPASSLGWTADDAEVWAAMQREKAAGRVRLLGVSNVSVVHLEHLGARPAFVQNRCYAELGWDREVRGYCREHGIAYQGFSLLTANVSVLQDPLLQRFSRELRIGIAPIIFAFARQLGILPLTGTTDPEHMQQDLQSLSILLPPEAISAIELLCM